MKRLRNILILVALALSGVCVLALTGSALWNLTLPSQSASIEILSPADKTRLAETRHLLNQLGDAVWPGWGQTVPPLILYNEEYAFLTGYPNPPDGWVKVPAGGQRGTAWDLVTEDDFLGEPYYRQQLGEHSPEAFTVTIGERWACSMPTLDWMQIGLMQTIRKDLPGFLQPVFPYSLFVGQLVSGDDQYISLIAHECFHAYQGTRAAEKLAEAEEASIQLEGQYPWSDEELQSAWQEELELLAAAIQTDEPRQRLELIDRFLEVRAARRDAAGLSPAMIAYEQKREWLEGLARYAELEIWRQAQENGYTAVPGTDSLPQFSNYANFEQRWSNELGQITRMASAEGDGRYYYTGMAQACLLDQLAPGWKAIAFDEDIWLDELLQSAAENR